MPAVVCPQCQLENPAGTTRCVKCSTPIEVATIVEPVEGATIASDTAAWSQAAEAAASAGAPGPIGPGTVLADRYEILKELGEGGMGAVYKARDRELDRMVALKVIRPELARHADILQRFKRELILARQITHRNVIRIFDLGVTGSTKFITMEYVEGQDLKSLLRHQKFTAGQAVDIMCQVCRGLEAAHSENVIHRDLKPQNIMVDQQGKVLVMDFGLAHSVEEHGMTQTGALMGTPDYMSPEQARAEKADARSDLFSLGIIFYELLTGKLPFSADSLLATLLARTQQRAKPVREIDPQIPQVVSDIVSKCLATDAAQRYQTATELLADLETWKGGSKGQTIRLPKGPWFRMVAPSSAWKWIALSVAGVAILLSPVAWYLLRSSGKPAAPPLSLAIVPFRNASGDPSLDWLGASIAEMLSTDVGQSAKLRTASPDRVYQILRDLRLTPESTLDQPTLRRVAEFSDAQTLVWGQYAKFGDQIRIDATLQDLKRERTTPLKAEAPNANGIPGAVDRLAQAIRQNLFLSPSTVKDLQAQAFKPSSKSLPALRLYTEGLQFLRQGRNIEAQKKLEAATKEDPQFALAYSKLAQAAANLGYDNEAEQSSRKAVDLSESLPPQEKYRIVAGHARITKDYPKAIESYENLAKVSPDDVDVESTLAALYEDTGVFQKAREHYARVLKADPKSVEALWAIGVVEINSDNPQGSLDYLNRALTLSIEFGNDEKKALILQATGVAYKLMNKPEEALRNYRESLAIQRRIGQKRGVAASLNEMAQVYSTLGKPQDALASFNEAMQVRTEIGAKKEIGDTLIDLGNFYEDRGQHDQALKMFKESLQIQRDSGDEAYQALCLNNIGNVHVSKGDYEDALTYFQQALQLREKLKVPAQIAETVYNLAETDAKLGQYDQALSQYLRALDLYRSAKDKRGAAIASYSLGSLFGYQGRYGAAVNSKEEAVKTFRELGDRSVFMAEVLSGYGGALADAGRWDEAQKTLNEALSLAREIKSEPAVAETLNLQGDSALYRGDLKSARALYDEALKTASLTKDQDKVLASKVGRAKAAIREGRFQEAISSLRSLADEANSMGMKYSSVECSTYLAEALVNTKDYSRARQELDRVLSRAEKLKLRTLLARGHYLLATILRLTGHGAEASGHYREGLRLLDEIRKEPGAGKVMDRSDLQPVYTESTRWAQVKTG